jgi:hypothetical protein
MSKGTTIRASDRVAEETAADRAAAPGTETAKVESGEVDEEDDGLEARVAGYKAAIAADGNEVFNKIEELRTAAINSISLASSAALEEIDERRLPVPAADAAKDEIESDDRADAMRRASELQELEDHLRERNLSIAELLRFVARSGFGIHFN